MKEGFINDGYASRDDVTHQRMTKFTAIVPIDLVSRADDIVGKAVLLAKAFSAYGAAIVFAHNDRRGAADKKFVQALSVARYPGVVVVSSNFYDGVVNPALLRNVAAPQVQTPVMLLLDVDIFADMDLFQFYADSVGRSAPFSMLPCLYLTKLGTKKVLAGELTPSTLKAEYFEFSRKYFLHLASPSSIIFMSTPAYHEIGGFDERFSGHGYEDFDFMVRLAVHYKVIEKPDDFMVNIVARSPLFVQGYRRELGRLVIPSLIKKDLVYHLHHERGERGDYSTQRRRNFELFKSKNEHCSDSSTRQDKTLLTAFICAVSELGLDVADYGIYFDNKPGHVDRFDTLRRRVRFLLDV